MKIVLPDPPPPKPLSFFSTEFLLLMYKKMFLIRKFELLVNELFLQGQIPGTIHLSHGQEATVVGTCLALRSDDFITLTHRGHGQALAKGVEPKLLLAELLGKAGGCCKGKGGSLHVGDVSVGALPAIAIVGASSPVAVGMAFAFKRKGSSQIVCNFFGESTVNKGDWHEAMNLASIWKLPVIFLCENNLYGVSTHITDVSTVERVGELGARYSMPGISIFGNDPVLVYEEVSQAVERARRGEGPSLIECLTYRHGGHKRDDPASYRPREEVEAWLKLDPISVFRNRMLDERAVTEDQIVRIEKEVEFCLQEALDYAKSSPYPPIEYALEHVYNDE